MKESEIAAVVSLRQQGLKFPEIARRLKMSIDQVKRRYYASSNDHKNKTVMAVNPARLSSGPKILFFDIETSPIEGTSWQLYETNIGHMRLDSHLLSFAYKWVDHPKVVVHALCDYPKYKKDMRSDRELAIELWKLFNIADIIVAHNGDAFDIKRANARFLVHGLAPPPIIKTQDTLKMARQRFKFSSNKLNDLGKSLGLGQKLTHSGIDLWIRCIAGEMEAWAKMKEYNIQDVVLLEQLYNRIQPWAKSYPNMNLYDGGDGCPRCLSSNIMKRGFEYKLTTKRQRFQCKDCGGWFSGGPPIKNDHNNVVPA